MRVVVCFCVPLGAALPAMDSSHDNTFQFAASARSAQALQPPLPAAHSDALQRAAVSPASAAEPLERAPSSIDAWELGLLAPTRALAC